MYFIRKFIIRYFIKTWKFIFGRTPSVSTESIVDSIQENLEIEGININKSSWDKFIDGLNRLPRPVGTFGVYALIGMAIFSPTMYKNIMLSLASTPDMMFVVYLTIIGFWFGGKIIEQVKTTSLLQSMKPEKIEERFNKDDSSRNAKEETKKEKIEEFGDSE